MSRFLGIVAVTLVVLAAMGFAAANAGHRVTVALGLFTLYRVPVALVAFSGLFIGMLVIFGAGIHTDLKVRRILRERLSEESRNERTWIDRNQQDLFADDQADAQDHAPGPGAPGPGPRERGEPSRAPDPGHRDLEDSPGAPASGSRGAEEPSEVPGPLGLDRQDPSVPLAPGAGESVAEAGSEDKPIS